MKANNIFRTNPRPPQPRNSLPAVPRSTTPTPLRIASPQPSPTQTPPPPVTRSNLRQAPRSTRPPAVQPSTLPPRTQPTPRTRSSSRQAVDSTSLSLSQDAIDNDPINALIRIQQQFSPSSASRARVVTPATRVSDRKDSNLERVSSNVARVSPSRTEITRVSVERSDPVRSDNVAVRDDLGRPTDSRLGQQQERTAVGESRIRVSQSH